MFNRRVTRLHSLRNKGTSRWLPGVVKNAGAGLMLSLWLVTVVLAASPALHELLHHDANIPHHHCAVTLLSQGQVDSATVEISASVPSVSIETTSQLVISFFAPAIENLPAGRAPPVSVSPLA